MNRIKKLFTYPYSFLSSLLIGAIIGYFYVGSLSAIAYGIMISGIIFIILDLLVTWFIIS